MPKRMNPITVSQILTNVFFVLMMLLIIGGMVVDSRGSFGLQKTQRAQINGVCVEGEWDECINFDERTVVEIIESGDTEHGGEIILHIRKVQ